MESKYIFLLSVALAFGLGSILSVSQCMREYKQVEAKMFQVCVEKTQRPLECMVSIQGRVK